MSTRPRKRVRRAINCEPCRQSKLKCDRNRPCSSCVLRDTTQNCFQDNPPLQSTSSTTAIDPLLELSSLKHSIRQLEEYLFPTPANPSSGLYSGPTSTATHLANSSKKPTLEPPAQNPPPPTNPYDQDILDLLPPLSSIDTVIAYHFDYCTWGKRLIYPSTFHANWKRYKNGDWPDRVMLGMVCVILAITVQFLPRNHRFVEEYTVDCTREELGVKYYDIMLTVLSRRDNSRQPRSYSLDLVELYLIRCHFHTICGIDMEESWVLRGQVVSMCLAMGLHRDPSKWKMTEEVADRRRWIWWNLMMVDRSQSFVFGRPTAIAVHHFDTQIPSPISNPSLLEPHISFFKLSEILGSVMNDAVSLRPVPYDNIIAHDRALTEWFKSIPSHIQLDDYQIARGLGSLEMEGRRHAVQSVISKLLYYRFRFTLHRTYASAAVAAKEEGGNNRLLYSLEAAVSAADRLIATVVQTQPDYAANQMLAASGYRHSGPSHIFPAAMFFVFQLIADPSQPGANLFRSNIQKALNVLNQSRDTPHVPKSLHVLNTLKPLYDAEFGRLGVEERERLKGRVLSRVRGLAFPYHDWTQQQQEEHSRRDEGSSEGDIQDTSTLDSSLRVQTPISSIRDSLVENGRGGETWNQVKDRNVLPSSSTTTRTVLRTTHNDNQYVFDPRSLVGPSPQTTFSSAPFGAAQTQHLYSLGGEDQMDWSTGGGGEGGMMDDAEMDFGMSLGFGEGEWISFLEMMQSSQ